MEPVDHIHELLPWFVAGTLEQAEADSFERHLPACDSCRAELVVLNSLRVEVEQHGESFFQEHPAADRLVAAVRGELDAAETATVRRHLALCSTCATEARWVSGEAVARGGSAIVPRSPQSATPGWSSRPWVWALLAASLVFALMLPAALRGRPGSGATGVRTSIYITATERSEGIPVYPLSDEGPVIVIMLEVDLPQSGFPATVELRTKAGKTIAKRSGIGRNQLADGAYISVSCERTRCPDGEYLGLVVPRPDSGERSIEMPFRLRSE